MLWSVWSHRKWQSQTFLLKHLRFLGNEVLVCKLKSSRVFCFSCCDCVITSFSKLPKCLSARQEVALRLFVESLKLVEFHVFIESLFPVKIFSCLEVSKYFVLFCQSDFYQRGSVNLLQWRWWAPLTPHLITLSAPFPWSLMAYFIKASSDFSGGVSLCCNTVWE